VFLFLACFDIDADADADVDNLNGARSIIVLSNAVYSPKVQVCFVRLLVNKGLLFVLSLFSELGGNSCFKFGCVVRKSVD
jgi:hypothetical protein